MRHQYGCTVYSQRVFRPAVRKPPVIEPGLEAAIAHFEREQDLFFAQMVEEYRELRAKGRTQAECLHYVQLNYFGALPPEYYEDD